MPSNSTDRYPVDVEIRRHHAGYPWTYELLDRRQREIAERARAGGRGALLLSEVAPVITMGRRTPVSDLLLPTEALKGSCVEVFRTDRGGLATYHGPGQWVVFVIDRLEALTGDRRGVRSAVEGLMGIAVTVGRQYLDDGSVEIRGGAETGVWCSRGKFAAVGVHVEDHVVLHGLAINGYRTPTSFQGIRPCGLDAPVAFLTEGAADREHAFGELGERICTAVFERFWR